LTYFLQSNLAKYVEEAFDSAGVTLREDFYALSLLEIHVPVVSGTPFPSLLAREACLAGFFDHLGHADRYYRM